MHDHLGDAVTKMIPTFYFKNRSIWLGAYFAIWLVVGLACSSSKKAFKKAQEYERSGLYVQAAEYDLRALDEKPDFKEALAHLKEMAPKAFDELQQNANNYEAAENWPGAVEEYEKILDFVDRLSRHGVVLATGNIHEKLEAARQEGAQYYFAQAESLFVDDRWAQAADTYLRVHNLVPNYSGAFQKAIDAYLRAGDHRLSRKDFENARRMYNQVLAISPHHSDGRAGVAETYYQQGRYYFREGEFRQALEAFEHTEKLISGYKDVGEWTKRSYQQAVQYVGVFPFQNQSDFPVDGYFLASEILGRALAANLRFVEFLPEARMNSLVNQLLKRGRNRLLEVELLELAKEEGLDSVVWGKVRNVRIEERPESFQEYEHELTRVVEDTSGAEVEEVTPIFYREYVSSRKVRVDIEYVILHTDTRRVLDKQRFREDIVDEARWIAYQGSIYDLPEGKRHLLDAPRDPRPPEVLVDELLVSVGKKIGREVERFYR